MSKILIVDADSVSRREAATLLSDEGHDVVEALRGAKGLKIAHFEQPDLVLADALLPDMDGGEFIQTLRLTTDGDQPHVIFRAPACIETDARSLASSHGGLFLVKPTDAAMLCSAVKATLAKDKPVSGPLPSAPELSEAQWRRLTQVLYLRTQKLERLNADLLLRNSKGAKQVKVARSAVDREIMKRVWAEQELARANLMLKSQPMRDFATGLHNRAYLEESLRREESRAQRFKQAFGVMMIDIDDLKHLNQTLGHGAGDAVLHALGEHMQSLSRGEDIVARYGGDEFALVMTQCPQSVVCDRAEKLRQAISRLDIDYKGQRIGDVTLSVGIGFFPDHGASGREVMQAADMALHQAKRLGRNCTVVGDTEFAPTITSAAMLETVSPPAPQKVTNAGAATTPTNPPASRTGRR